MAKGFELEDAEEEAGVNETFNSLRSVMQGVALEAPPAPDGADYVWNPQENRYERIQGEGHHRRIPNITARDRTLVSELSATGTPIDGIAAILRISPEDVQRFYAEELYRGGHLANAQVGRAVFHKAIQGDMQAATFWLKARAGWVGDRSVSEKNVRIVDENGAREQLRDKLTKRLERVEKKENVD